MELPEIDLNSLDTRALSAATANMASVFILALQLLNPTPVKVSIAGTGAEVRRLPGFFTYQDTALLTVSALIFGVSTTYLLTRSSKEKSEVEGNSVLDDRMDEWSEKKKELSENQREVYQELLDAEGVIAQKELTENTDLSKATISRTLDQLELKNMVERKTNGMTNTVVLK